MAILEDEQLVELYIESLDEKSILNNIYKGRIEGIIPGLKAAFVNIGLERNAFLHFDDVRGDLLLAKAGIPVEEVLPAPSAAFEEDEDEELEAPEVETRSAEVPPAAVILSAGAVVPPVEDQDDDSEGGRRRRRRRRGRRGGRKRREGELGAGGEEKFDDHDDEGPEEEELPRSSPVVPHGPVPPQPQAAGRRDRDRDRGRRDRGDRGRRDRDRQPPSPGNAAADWTPLPGTAAYGTRAAVNPYQDVFSPYSQPQGRRKWRKDQQEDRFNRSPQGGGGQARGGRAGRDSQEDFFPPPRPARPEEFTDEDELQPRHLRIPPERPYEPEEEESQPGNERFPSQRSSNNSGGSGGKKRRRRGGRGRSMKKPGGPSYYAARNKKAKEEPEEDAPKAARRKSAAKTAENKADVPAEKPARKSTRTSKTKAAAEPEAAAPAAEEKKTPSRATKSSAAAKTTRARKTAAEPETKAPPVEEKTPSAATAAEPAPEKKTKARRKSAAAKDATADMLPAVEPESPAPAPAQETAAVPAPAEEKQPPPKKGRGTRKKAAAPPSPAAEEVLPPAAVEAAPQPVEVEPTAVEPAAAEQAAERLSGDKAAHGGRSRRGRGRRGRGERTETAPGSQAAAGPGATPATEAGTEPAAAEAPPAQVIPIPQQGRQHGRPERERDRDKGDRRPARRRIPLFTDVFKKGDELMVQVTKEEIGMKGARISSYVSLPGRYLVLLPYPNEEGGVSRKVEDQNERKRLKRILRDISASDEHAFIVRTAGIDRDEEEIAGDVEFLRSEWRNIQQRYDRSQPGDLVYDDHNILYRLARDVFDDNIGEILVDSAKVAGDLREILSKLIPNLVDRVQVYDEGENIFHKHQVEKQITKAARRKVWLKSGGYIIIDEAEALTAIDVNSGKFIGKDDQEKMILKTNLEAARTIARELKLRDIGGLIVIDFIDMKDQRNRDQLLAEFRQHLRKDRSKTAVSSVSEFGLVEMTRKRVRRSLRKTLFMDCPYCQGAGVILNEQQIWLHIKHEVLRLLEAGQPYPPSLSITVNPRIRAYVDQNYQETLQRIEQKYAVQIRWTISDVFHMENYSIEKLSRDYRAGQPLPAPAEATGSE